MKLRPCDPGGRHIWLALFCAVIESRKCHWALYLHGSMRALGVGRSFCSVGAARRRQCDFFSCAFYCNFISVVAKDRITPPPQKKVKPLPNCQQVVQNRITTPFKRLYFFIKFESKTEALGILLIGIKDVRNWSRIEYLLPTIWYCSASFLRSNLMKNVASLTDCNTIFG